MINFILYILFGFAGFCLGGYTVAKKASVKIDNLKQQNQKYLTFFKLMLDWVLKEADGRELVCFLKKRDYNNIAIYGMGIIGQTLVDVLKKQDINVLYVIDRRTLHLDLPIYSPLDKLPDVDIIINTAILDKDSVKQALKERSKCEIVSIDEII